jgi:hypothetical protein
MDAPIPVRTLSNIDDKNNRPAAYKNFLSDVKIYSITGIPISIA